MYLRYVKSTYKKDFLEISILVNDEISLMNSLGHRKDVTNIFFQILCICPKIWKPVFLAFWRHDALRTFLKKNLQVNFTFAHDAISFGVVLNDQMYVMTIFLKLYVT